MPPTHPTGKELLMTFEKIIDGILAVEKGYVDHPADRGGPTNYGITQAVARSNGYSGDMRAMPEAFARQVYVKRYITEPGFDTVHHINPAIGEELIDTGVNMGPGRAAEFLQKWLNGFNADNRLGGDLFVDGRLGPQTFNMLTRFISWRGQAGVVAMVRALNGSQAARYLEIAEGNKSQRAFLFGWISNRVV
jgi:lysozyme family protein